MKFINGIFGCCVDEYLSLIVLELDDLNPAILSQSLLCMLIKTINKQSESLLIVN